MSLQTLQAKALRRMVPAAGAGLLAFVAQAVADTPLDITFLQVGDTHYQAFDATTGNFNSANRANLAKMMQLTPATDMPGAGTVGTPLGVIACGDLINSGTETDPTTGQTLTKSATMEMQWANFTKDFGLLGNEADSVLKYPVYEGYGNHDQDGFLKQESDYIAARAAQHPNLTAQSGTYTYVGGYGNISVTGVHYAWKWGPVHFVQVNMRIGDGIQRYPCSGSYTFLKNYLENTVGSSGDPVFVIVHLPPSTGAESDWPAADRQAFYDLARRFNTVGVLVGHVHSYAYFDWSGPAGNGDVPIKVYQCDSLNHTGTTQGIFSVFRILGDPVDSTKATLYVAQRLRNNTWGASASRVISLSSTPPPPPPPTGLAINEWQSVNLHSGVPGGLPITDDTFVEPRQGGIRQIEVLFAEAINVTNLSSAVTVTGVNASGPVSLASLGITTNVAIGGAGDTLVVTFANGGGAVALPDVAKWRFTLNTGVISGVASGAVLGTSAPTSRVITGLVGDLDGNGRVTGRDLNEITNTTAFEATISACVRADIDGNAQLDNADLNTAWANRNHRVDNLATP